MGVFRYVGLPVLVGKVQAAAVSTVEQGANYLVQQAEEVAPHKTGLLGGGIHTDGARVNAGGAEAVVKTGAESNDYNLAQHEGSEPHIIRAKNAKALHFGDTFAKEVHHPGNPATKFLTNPLLQMSAEYRAFARAHMRAQF